MNKQPSPSDPNDDQRSSSPRRKKVRQKYAPKACVSCRKSKLKCSGHNPCQRCRDNGRRCFFSEDQTAAEALQNLSRPSLSHPPAQSMPNSNDSGLARRNPMPSHRHSERTSSDAGAPGLSMEARMARMEAMMEVLLQERAMYTPSSGDAGHGDFGSDMPVPVPVTHPSNSAVSFLDQASHSIHAQDAIDPLLETNTTSLRVGSQSFAFPVHAAYLNHIDSFFREVQVCYPCIDERLFRARSAKMLARSEVDPNNVCFLALNYIIFALHVASTEPMQPCADNKLPGWHWLQLADDVVGKRQLYGQGDISLAQFLLFKAIYCTLVDQPGLAYNTIGLASRYVLQQSLNRPSPLPETGVWESFERLRVFWNILIADRRIALSCRRPYTIRDIDIAVERPGHVFQTDTSTSLHVSQDQDHLNDVDSGSMFLGCMIDWSRFAGSLWDGILAPHVSADTIAKKVATFDAAIVDYLGGSFGSSMSEFQPPQRHSYICLSFDNLRSIAQRAMLVSPTFDHTTVNQCCTTAADTLGHVQAYEAHMKYPLTCLLRIHIVPSLASSLLLLCSIFVSNIGELDLPLINWLPAVHETFDTAIALLQDLARDIPFAVRVLKDFQQILPVVQAVLEEWSADGQILYEYGPAGWKMIKRLIPSNAVELLPYQEHVPDLRSATPDSRISVSNRGHMGLDHECSNWDESFVPLGSGNGVLWV